MSIPAWRAGNAVKRYHTQPRLIPETVGHHSANVCAILLHLDPSCSRNLLLAALQHDLPEALTGDIPAPAKWKSSSLQASLSILENEWGKEHGITTPNLTAEEHELLKLADILDLTLSSLEECRLGNSYAKDLVAKGQRIIQNAKVKAVVKQKCYAMIDAIKGA